MGYLRYFDYLRQIQDAQLKQVITNDDTNRTYTERAAQDEMISYLVQKYDTAQEFTDTTVFDITTNYQSQALIELNFTAYSATSTYALNDLVTQAGKCYINTTAIGVAEPFNAAHWKLLGSQYDLFFIAYPYHEFDVKAIYNEGDKVFWRGKNYICQIATRIPDHRDILQDATYDNVGEYNTFPDDIKNGVQHWGVGVSYIVTGLVPTVTYAAWAAGTYNAGTRVTKDGLIWKCIATTTTAIPGADITNWQPETWTTGDNRSSQLVQKMVDITLYHLLSRIAPRNVPELRIKRYDDAIGWLKDAINGIIVADIPEKQILKGTVTRYGGSVKRVNDY